MDLTQVVTRFAGGIVLWVWVQPGARRTELSGLRGSELRITQRAVHGAANTALVAYLAEMLSVAKRDVEIIYGHTSRSKRARIYTKEPIALESRLSDLGRVSVGQALDTVRQLGGT